MNTILESIAQKQLIGFMYGGFYRIVEPYLLGVYKGKVQLLCYQIGGESSSGKLPEWRRMNIEGIAEAKKLDISFVGARPTKGLMKAPFDRILTPVSLPVERQPKTFYLVSATDQKRTQPCEAKELYRSTWFKLARAFVEQQKAAWFVVSTKHGLLSPEAHIEPYDKALDTMSEVEQSEWAEKMFAAMQPKLFPNDKVVILAGAHIRELLTKKFTEIGCEVEAPLKGKRIGEQAHWFKQNTSNSNPNQPLLIAG